MRRKQFVWTLRGLCRFLVKRPKEWISTCSACGGQDLVSMCSYEGRQWYLESGLASNS